MNGAMTVPREAQLPWGRAGGDRAENPVRSAEWQLPQQ